MSGKIRYIIEKLYRGILASMMKIKRESSIAGLYSNAQSCGQYCNVGRICKHRLNYRYFNHGLLRTQQI